MVEEMGEPLLQYKHWEMHLRNNPIPEKLKSAIENSEPLTPLLQEKIKQMQKQKKMEIAQ